MELRRSTKVDKTIHNHPRMEQLLGVPEDHVIIDRAMYEAIHDGKFYDYSQSVLYSAIQAIHIHSTKANYYSMFSVIVNWRSFKRYIQSIVKITRNHRPLKANNNQKIF